MRPSYVVYWIMAIIYEKITTCRIVVLLITSKNIASFFGKDESAYEIGGEKIESNL